MALNRLFSAASGHLDPNYLGLSVCIDPLIDLSDPARSIEHINLLGQTAFEHVGSDHRDFVQSSGPKDRGRMAASFSIFAHEVRHFHDLLLTCYGSFLARQALQLNMGYFSLIRDEITFCCDSVYLPLSDWVNNYGILSKCYRELSPPPNIIVRYVKEYEQLRPVLSTFENGNLNSSLLTSTSILEASAIIAQEEYLRSNFGIPSVVEFDAIFEGDSKSLYFGALYTMINVLGEELPLDIQAYVLFASLCGDYRCETGISYSTPTDTFLLLLTEIKKSRADFKSPEKVAKVVQSFFDRAGWGSPVDSIKRAHKENRDLLARYRQDFDGREVHESVQTCLRAFENFIEVQSEFLRWFCQDPLGYFDLRKYCRDLFSLPLPPIYLECQRGLPYSRELLPKFDLVSGNSVRVQELPLEARGQLTEYHDEEGYLTLWHLISLRASDAEQQFVPPVDVNAWQQQANWSMTSAFLEESNRSAIPGYLADDQIMAMSAFGTTVITADGILSTKSLIRPDRLSASGIAMVESVKDLKKGDFQVDPGRKLDVKFKEPGELQVILPVLLPKKTHEER